MIKDLFLNKKVLHILFIGWCYTWGRRGGCHRYKAFMKDYCPKTCNMCTEVEVTSTLLIQDKCSDNDVRCPAWAKYTDYKCPSKFLTSNCKKSCQICTTPTFMDAQNNDYGAVIIQSGHGDYLGDGSGCNPTFTSTVCNLLIVNAIAAFFPLILF